MAVPIEEAIAALSTFLLEKFRDLDFGCRLKEVQLLVQLLPDSMKQSQADLYLETYQVVDLEMSRLREIQQWQASASSKEYLQESVQVQPSHHGMLADSVSWGGCTIIYLLGQQLHFELFDFSHQVLNVAEVEAASVTSAHRNSHFLQEKQACAIKQSGAPLHRIKFENTVSAFETLPQKGA